MIIVIMGVSGCGKSTIGKALAESLQMDFYDGDDFHPAYNIDKLSRGIPLTDADRLGWLKAINEKANEIKTGVFACSALKESYRQILFSGLTAGWQLVYLKGSFDLISHRLQKRKEHFMSAKLLQSQFDILEEPEYGIQITVDQDVVKTVSEIRQKLGR